MIGPDTFVARCIECLADGGGAREIADLTRLALVSQREDRRAWGSTEVLHCCASLMVVDLTLPPFATSAIHEHNMWAVVGVSEGCEVDELLQEGDGGLNPTSRYPLAADEVLVLPPDCIHFIANPLPTPARGIHVYGGNLAKVNRRMWDPVTCVPRPMDFAVFEEWERGLTARSAANGAIVGPAIRSTPSPRIRT